MDKRELLNKAAQIEKQAQRTNAGTRRIHNSSVRTSLPRSQMGDEYDCDLAQWLEESGRRKMHAGWIESLYKKPTPSGESTQQRASHIAQPGMLSLLGVVAGSYLLYYFADLNLQILSMHSVVYFVAVS